MEGLTWSTDLPGEGKEDQFTRIERELCGYIGGINRMHCVCTLEPHRQQTDCRGTHHTAKESTPVVAHCKVCCGHLNAEEHS